MKKVIFTLFILIAMLKAYAVTDQWVEMTRDNVLLGVNAKENKFYLGMRQTNSIEEFNAKTGEWIYKMPFTFSEKTIIANFDYKGSSWIIENGTLSYTKDFKTIHYVETNENALAVRFVPDYDEDEIGYGVFFEYPANYDIKKCYGKTLKCEQIARIWMDKLVDKFAVSVSLDYQNRKLVVEYTNQIDLKTGEIKEIKKGSSGGLRYNYTGYIDKYDSYNEVMWFEYPTPWGYQNKLVALAHDYATKHFFQLVEFTQYSKNSIYYAMRISPCDFNNIEKIKLNGSPKLNTGWLIVNHILFEDNLLFTFDDIKTKLPKDEYIDRQIKLTNFYINTQ